MLFFIVKFHQRIKGKKFEIVEVQLKKHSMKENDIQYLKLKIKKLSN